MNTGLNLVGKYPTLNTFGNSLNLQKAEVQEPNIVSSPVDKTPTSDVVNLSAQKIKPKTMKDRVANVWKSCSVAGKMVGATAKGLLYGAATTFTLLAGSWVFKSLPKAFTKEGPKLWATIRHPLKHISKSGKVIAGLGGAIILGYHLVAGKLDANQRTAVIDHKMKTGHRDA